MPFSGLSSNDLFTASLVQEDVARLIRTLSPKETPLLDFLGDAPVFATSTKHEYIEDFMLPNYIVASAAINSATAATGILVNGLGLGLTVGTLLENESAAPEVMQVTSIAGPNSILVSRNYGGGGTGSLVAGGSLYVREMAGIEGQDHSGADTRRLGNRKANAVGMFRIELATSDTERALDTHGNDGWDSRIRKGLVDVLHQLEKAVVRGVVNSTNSLASATTTRTMNGIRAQVTSVNSTVVAASFATNPHLYIGNVWEQAWRNGASDSETWAIIAGSTWFRDLSNLNDTKVQDSNEREIYKRVIRTYAGPFGRAELFLSRVLGATELLLVPRERLAVPPLQGRSFTYTPMAKTGDNEKGLIVGEYTMQVHHESAMARLRV